MEKWWAPLGIAGVVLVVLVPIAAGMTEEGDNVSVPEWAFFVSAAILAASILLIGYSINGKWLGALIDNTNRMSLAQFQLLAWTVVFAALFSLAVGNNLAEANAPQPTDDMEVTDADRFFNAFPSVPGEMWVLLGISVTSLAGSPLMQNTKRADPPGTPRSVKNIATAATATGTDEEKAAVVRLNTANIRTIDGLLTIKQENAPSVRDMFRGEDEGNFDKVDVGKIQMFYFTILLVFLYAAAAIGVLAEGGRIDALPAMSEGVVALLAISHAGFLGNEAVPRKPA